MRHPQTGSAGRGVHDVVSGGCLCVQGYFLVERDTDTRLNEPPQPTYGRWRLAQRSEQAAWMSEHQIWDVEKLKAYVTNQDEAVTFFCGGSKNFPKFIDLLDGVFVLDVDLDTMNRRIDERVALDPTDFGGKPEERELAVRLHQTKQDIPNNGIIIDATAPLARVVDEILRICG